MDIKVGEYVRLARNQGINKIIDIKDGFFILDIDIADEWGDETCRIEHHKIDEEILNHSEEPIDLIEEGDYVNGYPVRKINGKLCNFDLNEMEWTPLENIDVWENIVTKEQFEKEEYVFGGK